MRAARLLCDVRCALFVFVVSGGGAHHSQGVVFVAVDVEAPHQVVELVVHGVEAELPRAC